MMEGTSSPSEGRLSCEQTGDAESRMTATYAENKDAAPDRP